MIAPTPDVPDPLLGQTIDQRYLIEKMLGEGGMGIVYKAVHTVIGKSFALKVLRSDVSRDQEVMQRFMQEAQSAAAIGNEHIIDITDFGKLPDGARYFVMEFLDGSSLSSVLEKDRPLSAARTIHIGKQLCDALGAAHERQIVHRDMKPDNIYLVKKHGDRDFVKVLDFGIAKVAGGSSKLTRAGQVFGTPHYMSPEQCAGTNVDQRTDIYAVGVILYEMASGRVPFDADNLMGILTKHLYENPIPPHELPPPTDVPPGLEAIIMKCLAKKPEQRYQTMAEMRADLERAEAGVTPAAVVEAVDRTSGSGGLPPLGREPTGRTGLTVGLGEPVDGVVPKKSAMPLVAAAIAAVLLLGGGAAAFVAMSGNKDPRPTPSVANAPHPSPPPVIPSPSPSASVGQGAGTPPPSVAPVMVAVTSSPPGAQIFENGALVGPTPMSLPRPIGAETRALELRLEGYQPQPVVLLAGTPETFIVPLSPVARGGRSGRTSRTGPSTTATPSPEPATTMQEEPHTRPPHTTTDVVDPWAN